MLTLDFAKEELARYYHRITGAEHAIVLSVDMLDDWADHIKSSADDAFAIDVTSGAGTIVGVNARSVLLGVYKYLTCIGCRFITPGKGGEIIPNKDASECSVSVNCTPSYRHRGICIEGSVSLQNILDIVDWLPKNGCNAYFMQFRDGYEFFERWYAHTNCPGIPPEPFTVEDAHAFTQQIEAEVQKRSLLYHKVGHGWTCECLPKRIPSIGWYTVDNDNIPVENRELLAQINGKREYFGGAPLNTNLCFSNPDARKHFVNEVVRYAQSNPTVDMLHIWLGDACNNHCECNACRQRTPTDWYVILLNEIDAALTANKLPTRLVFLIYFELLWPSMQQRLHNPSRFTLMYAPITRTYTRPYLEEDSEAELPALPEYVFNKIKLSSSVKENLAFLRAWQNQFEGDSFAFEYHLMWDVQRECSGLRLAEVIYADCRCWQTIGLQGLISCQINRASFPTGLCQYVMAQVLFDTNRQFEDIVEEYMTAAFGQGASLAMEYLKTLQEAVPFTYLREESSADAERIRTACDRLKQMFTKIEGEAQNALGMQRERSWRTLLQSNSLYVMLAEALVEKLNGATQERLEELAEQLMKRAVAVEKVCQSDFDANSFELNVVRFFKKKEEKHA